MRRERGFPLFFILPVFMSLKVLKKLDEGFFRKRLADLPGPHPVPYLKGGKLPPQAFAPYEGNLRHEFEGVQGIGFAKGAVDV